MYYRHLLLCASLSLLGACSGTMDDDITEISCDDSHGCPNGLSCMENVCVGGDASIANDQVQATGEASGAPAVVEVETGGCKGPSCEIAAGSDVTFRAPTLEGYRFTGWSGDERCQGSSPALMLEDVAANIHCVANYVKRVVIAGISAEPGASVGAASGAGFASCGATSCEVDQGSTVTLTASALSGHRFAGFTGDGCATVSGGTVTVVAADANVTCTANYALVYSVTGNIEGSDGQVAAASSTPFASCTANSCSVDAGATVTLTAPTSAGYRFTSWSGSAGCAGNDTTLVLSNISAATLCTAHYVPRFSVTGDAVGLANPPFIGATSDDLFAQCAEGGCEVDEGSTVQLVAPSVTGYVFIGFTGDGCDDPTDLSGTTLTLEDIESDLACKAQYQFLPAGSVSVVGNIVGAPGVITALPSPPCANGSCVITEGSDVTLTAPNLAPAYRFLGWRGANQQDQEEDTLCSASSLTRVLNDVARNISCVARYTPRYEVDGASAGGGVVDASSADANSSCGAGKCTVDAGKSVTLTPVPSSGYRFGNWTGGGPCVGSAALTLSNVSNDITCTAHFVRQFSVLYAAGTGGTVSAPNDRCPNGSPCKVDTGSGLDITAVPSNGYRFGSWSGAGCTDNGSTTPLVANLSNIATDVTCTANFVQTYVVTYGAGAGGSVSAPAGACPTASPCTVDKSSSLAVTAVPAAGYRFDSWSGQGCTDNVTGTKLVADLANISANITCTASFIRQVTVSFPDPANGAVAASNAGPNASCTSTSCAVDVPGTIQLAATADTNYRFTTWSHCSTSTTTPLSLSGISADATCNANFVRRWTIAGSTSGAPGGITVSAAASQGSPQATCTNPAPGAGNCVVDQGVNVTLTASAVANNDITGWTGTGCAAGVAGANNTTLTFTNVSAAASCAPVYAPRVTITIAKTPSDIPNTIQISGPGCAANGTSCTVPSGSTVTLTAGDSKSSTFLAWKGSQCNGNTASLNFTATQTQTCTADFSGYWAMTFSQSNTSGEAYNAILPVKEDLFAFGTHADEARSARLNPNSGVMLGNEQLFTLSTYTFNWVDAASISDIYAALGRISGRASGGVISGGGSKSWLRQIQSEYTSTYTKITELKDSFGICGYANTRDARVILAKLDSLTSADSSVQPSAEARFHRLSSCEKGALALATNARGISAVKGGGYAMVTHSAGDPQTGIPPLVWMALAKDTLEIADNGHLDFSATKVTPSALDISEVLPTPDLGGFLIVGSMTIRTDQEGMVIKVNDALTPEWGYYFDNPGYDDIFTGATIAADGDFVLVGATDSEAQGIDGWFVRLSKDGKTIVRNRGIGTADPFKGAKDEDFLDVRPAPRGGFFIAGRSITTPAAWALHVDEAGNLIFQTAANAHNAALTLQPVDLAPKLGAKSCLVQSAGDAKLTTISLGSTNKAATAVRQAW